MTAIGDRFREIADLYDKQPNIICAGAIVREDEVVVSAFSESHDNEARGVAAMLYHGVMSEPDTSMFREVDERPVS